MSAPLAFPINGDALPGEIEPRPIEVDPPCGLCGRAIDEHFRVDTFDGSIFLCEDALFAGDLVRQWELVDARDAWRHTGEPPPPASVRNSDIAAKPASAPRPYRPAQSTIDAFRYLAAAGDVERLRVWLADRPKDAPYLLSLLERQDHA
jgi:hypothetical protein